MMNPIKKFTQEFAFTDNPSLGDYMFGALMLIMATVVFGLISAIVIMLLILTFPWSVAIAGFILAVMGSAWYSWYRDQNPKVKRVRLKK